MIFRRKSQKNILTRTKRTCWAKDLSRRLTQTSPLPTTQIPVRSPKIHNNIIINYCNLITTQLNYNSTNFLFYIIIAAFSVSDSHSQEPTEFATQLGFSEDSNSQNSEPPPAKQIKTE